MEKFSFMDKVRNKLSFAFHKHHFIPTGEETIRHLSEWHIQKVKETECDICGKKSIETISYMRV